jgi:argininosuccinate synthase
MHLKDSLVPRYADLIYNGYWFSPEMRSMQTLIDSTQNDVTGTVRMKLYKGNCIVAGRKSAKSLYSTDFATFEADTVYDQADATGFIRLNGLRLKINRLLRG